MLKSGQLFTSEIQCDFYEVIENNYYRIDFVETSALFNLGDPLYSQIVKKGKTYTFGDSSIFELYDTILATASTIQKTVTKSSEWRRGKFVTRVLSVNEKFNCKVENIFENALETETYITLNGSKIESRVLDKVYGVQSPPVNFKSYQELTLTTDTLNETPNAPYYSLEVLKRHYDISHIDDNDFVVADDEEIATQRLNEWASSNGDVLGFDTETTGLDVFKDGEDKVVGIILGETETKSTYFPFRHKEINNLSLDFMKILMELVIKNQYRLVAHNGKFDRESMLKEGYDLLIAYDTLWGSMILNPIIGRGHDLKTLVYKLDHKKYLELNEIFVSPKDIDFSILPKDIVKAYGCPDGSNVIKLYHDQIKKIPNNQYRLWDLENRLSWVCADMEYYGIRVDVKKYEQQYQNCNYIIEQLLEAFRTLTHEDGNINSAEVLKNLIYNKMKCPVYKRTKTGEPSTSSSVIKMLGSKKAKEPHNITQDLVDMNGKTVISAKQLSESAYPAMLILAKYKEYNKLKTAFYARFEKTMHTGRVYFWINQWGAATGRQSSPMHQLPPDLKDCVLSDSDDKDFWGPDFSQVELRMIAYLAGEQDLIDLAMDPGNDIHRAIGSLISGLDMWQITPKMRSQGKRRNFGVVYLISAMGLAGQMFGPAYTKENVKFCQGQLDEFYGKFKRIDRYIKHNAQLVQQRGYMETKWFHRRRDFSEIFDPNIEPRRKASLLRMANNVPVQGTAADYLKLAEVQMYQWIRARGWNKIGPDGFPMVRMMLSIHDELIISSDRSIPYEEIITMITKCMETPVEGAPPFFVQPALMENWGEHSNDACAMPVELRDKLIKDYLETGVSVINKENYLEVLDKFRRDQLTNYMSDLIKKYGPDPINVGNHVRHPSLTFDLLDLFHSQLKDKEDLDQAELINEATKLYMSGNAVEPVKEDSSTTIEVKISDKDLFTDELEAIVNFDANGNVVYDEDNSADDIDYATDDEVEEVDLRVNSEPTYAWKLNDVIVLDTYDIASNDDINELLKHMMVYYDPKGFYKTMLIYNSKLLDTKISVEHCDIEEINKYIIDMVEKEKGASS